MDCLCTQATHPLTYFGLRANTNMLKVQIERLVYTSYPQDIHIVIPSMWIILPDVHLNTPKMWITQLFIHMSYFVRVLFDTLRRQMCLSKAKENQKPRALLT